MIITKQSDYAIRLMLAIADSEMALTTKQVAQAHKIPIAFLHKVVSNLVHANLLRTKRGVNGGIILGKDPIDISLYDIILAIEQEMVIHSCTLHGKPCKNISVCAIHDVMNEITNDVLDKFSQVTLDQLLDRQRLKPLSNRISNRPTLKMASE